MHARKNSSADGFLAFHKEGMGWEEQQLGKKKRKGREEGKGGERNF